MPLTGCPILLMQVDVIGLTALVMRCFPSLLITIPHRSIASEATARLRLVLRDGQIPHLLERHCRGDLQAFDNEGKLVPLMLYHVV